MDRNARHGLIIGAVVGAALAAFYWYNGGNPYVSVIFVPIGAVLGMSPWLLKAKQQ